MGSLHSKYLDSLNVKWLWYDNYFAGNICNDKKKNRVLNLDNLDLYSHIIISSPTKTHESYLKKINNKNFKGKILVEKPGIINKENLNLLDNDNLMVGLIERFNPVFLTLKNNINKDKVISIDFVRTSGLPVERIKDISFVDVGIHDLDLFCNLFDNKKIKDISTLNNKNTTSVSISLSNGIIARFIWSNESHFKERSIKIIQDDCVFICDLDGQSLKKYGSSKEGENTIKDFYIEKKSPILCELENFIKYNTHQKSILSHELFLDILETLNNDKHIANEG